MDNLALIFPNTPQVKSKIEKELSQGEKQEEEPSFKLYQVPRINLSTTFAGSPRPLPLSVGHIPCHSPSHILVDPLISLFPIDCHSLVTFFQPQLRKTYDGFSAFGSKEAKVQISSVVPNLGSSDTSCLHQAAKVQPQQTQSHIPKVHW